MTATGTAGTTTISNATTTVQGTTALNIGNDTNTGTITVGSANKTLNLAAATTNITGNLNITGTTPTLNATNTTFNDNAITLHAMPAGTADSVVLYQRYPADVVTENLNTYTLTCTTASSGTSLTCSSLGTATVATILYSFFVNNGNYLYVTAATGTGPWTLTLSQAISAATGTSVTAYSRVSAGLLYTENASTKGFNLAYYSASDRRQANSRSIPNLPMLTCVATTSTPQGPSAARDPAGPSLQVTILSTSTTPVTLPSTYAAITTSGSYMVVVSPVVAGNATATFMISKSLATQASGNVFRLTSASGTLGAGPFEELCISWPASTLPQVYH